MRFWDSSAIVALLIEEEHSQRALSLLEDDREATVSFITLVEVAGAIARRRLPDHARAFARSTFDELRVTLTVVREYDEIVSLATTIAERHRLRTGDAFQLASLIVTCRDTVKLPFVSLDEDLAAAARLKGFPTLP